MTDDDRRLWLAPVPDAGDWTIDEGELHALMTRAYNEAAKRGPRLRFFCSGNGGSCSRRLGVVVLTTYGPLFVSWWPVFDDTAEVLKWESTLHSVVTLLEVPAGTPAFYADLLLRCKDHGDVVLDRLETLSLARRTKKLASINVDVSFPHRKYDEWRAAALWFDMTPDDLFKEPGAQKRSKP